VRGAGLSRRRPGYLITVQGPANWPCHTITSAALDRGARSSSTNTAPLWPVATRSEGDEPQAQCYRTQFTKLEATPGCRAATTSP